MGALNYNFRFSGADGTRPTECPNAAVAMTDTNGSTFSAVTPKSGYSNDHEFWKDGSNDAAPAESRYVTAVIDFTKCTGLVTTSGSRYDVTMTASGEPLFGMQRSSTSQAFTIKFVD